jgi:NADH:ubiquinone oxidoreductase subunit K
LAIPAAEALTALAYGAAYSAVILGLTVFFFRRRDLP